MLNSRFFSLLLAGVIAATIISAPLKASAAADAVAEDMLSRYIISYADSTGLVWSVAGGLTASAAISLLSNGIIAEYAASIGTSAAALFTEVAAGVLPVVGGVVLAAGAVAIIVAIINYMLEHRGLSEPSSSPVTSSVASGLSSVTIGGTRYYIASYYSDTSNFVPDLMASLPASAQPSYIDASSFFDDIYDPVSYLWDDSSYTNGALNIPVGTYTANGVTASLRYQIYKYESSSYDAPYLYVRLQLSNNGFDNFSGCDPFVYLNNGMTYASFILLNGVVYWYNAYASPELASIDPSALPNLRLPFVYNSRLGSIGLSVFGTSYDSSIDSPYYFTESNKLGQTQNYYIPFDSASYDSSVGSLDATRPSDYVEPVPVASTEQVTLSLPGDATDYATANDAITALSDAVLVDGEHITAVISAAPVDNDTDWTEAPAVSPAYDITPTDQPGGNLDPSDIIGVFPVTSFATIWHYVLELLAYGRNGVEILLAAWRSLPYAIRLPYYASIAVAIIFGVFMRILI